MSLDERLRLTQTAGVGVTGRFGFAAFALASSSTVWAADDGPICAARPGKSTPVCTVPAGRFQLETGLVDWSLQKSNEERDSSLAIGETTFKYGLTDHSDIEVDVAPWQRSASRSAGIRDRASGFGDVTVAYKQQLTSNEAALQAAVQPVVKIPTARRALGNGRWEAGVLLPLGYAIPKTSLSLGATPELDWVADGDGRGHHVAMAQVVSLGWAASGRLGVSAELWGQWDWDPAVTMRQYSADASIAFLPRNDVQLDAGANFGLNRETPHVELYAGVSKRF